MKTRLFKLQQRRTVLGYLTDAEKKEIEEIETMGNTIDGKTFNEFLETEMKEWQERATQLQVANGDEDGDFAHFFDTLPREQAITNFCESCIMHSKRVRRIADAWEAVIGEESELMHRLAMSYSLLARMPLSGDDGLHHALCYIKEVEEAINDSSR